MSRSDAALQGIVLPAMRGGLSSDEKAELDGHLASLTQRQLQYVAFRLRTEDDDEALAMVGVTSTTLRRWAAGGHLAPALALLRRASVWESMALVREGLMALTPKAVQAISDSLDSSNEWLRFQAAVALLDRLGISRLADADAAPPEVGALAAWLMAVRGGGEGQESGGR